MMNIELENKLNYKQINLSIVKIGRIIFGDRTGLTLFLGSISFVSLFWQAGIFITDTNTVVNSLIAVADGHLNIEQFVWGSPLNPRVQEIDGVYYGRNYGHVFFTLPFFWVLKAASVLFEPRLFIVGIMSLLYLAFFINLGLVTDRRRLFTFTGTAISICFFVLNIVYWTKSFESKLLPLLALAMSTIVFGGMTVVMLYRLIKELYGRKEGILAGMAVVLATPIGFWTLIPKRHAIIAMLTVTMVYFFYKARSGSVDLSTRYRSLSYAVVGLATWVSSPPAALLFLALVPVDLLTARDNNLDNLAIIGVVFTISLLPFFITNALVSGNPLRPPLLLPNTNTVSGGKAKAVGGGAVQGSGIKAIVGAFSLFVQTIFDGLSKFWDKPLDVYHTFIRSGRIPGMGYGGYNKGPNEISVLESFPLSISLVLVPILGLKRIVGLDSFLEPFREGIKKPERMVDLLVIVVSLFSIIFWMRRLPIAAQITVRYLIYIFPLILYGIIRLSIVRKIINQNTKYIVWSYIMVVLIGTQIFIVTIMAFNMEFGEMIQFHAIINIATAVFLLFTLLIASQTKNIVYEKLGGVGIGLSAGVVTMLLIYIGLLYSRYGDYVLPVFQHLSDIIYFNTGI